MDVNLCREDGLSFFYIVCECGCYNIVWFLLSYDIVNVNLCDREGCNVFMYVCKYGYE